MIIDTPAQINPRCLALGSKYFPIFWLATDPPILVEGGVSAVIPRVLREINKLDLALPQILILLHEHSDHVLGAPPLRRALNLEILASKESSQLLAKEKVIKGYREADRFFTHVLKSREEGEEGPWETFPPIHPLEETSLPSGLHILSTPGHSPGSMALFWEEEGILMASDSLGYYSSRGKHFPLFFQSLELYLKSIRLMAQTEPGILVLGHLQCFFDEEAEEIFKRSQEEALTLAQKVKRAGDMAQEMVYKAIRQDELVPFYPRETIQECARLLVKRSQEA